MSVIPTQITVRDAEVERIAATVSQASGLFDRFEAQLPKVGRPRGWTARQMLTVFFLNAATSADFQLDRIPDLLAGLTQPQRRVLGLPVGTVGESPFSRRQISRAWALLSSMVDSYDPTIDEGTRDRRERFALAVQTELLAATIPPQVLANRGGHVAVDATKVWAWGRPPSSGREKLTAAEPRAGTDDTGEELDPETVYLSIEQSTPSSHPSTQSTGSRSATESAVLPSGRRRRRDAGKRATGAAWVGDTNPAKSVYGYQHHVGVLTPPPDRAWNVPVVATFCTTGPANANPAAMSIPALFAYDRHRRSRSHGPGLVEVLADGGYTGLRAFLDELRAHQISVTFRLHGRNQEGVRGSVAEGQVVMIDGTPHCSCAPDRDLRYPWRPQTDKTDYRTRLAWRSRWELTRMQSSRTGTGTRFRSPHHGTGCEYCRHLLPGDRCCQQATYTIPARHLRLAQAERHGSPEWQMSYARRSCVEGFFGALKNPALTGVSRLTARFFEYGKVALATLLRVAATNLAMVSTWERRQHLADDLSWRMPPLSTFMPTSDPTPDRPHVSTSAARRRGPPGLAHLAVDP